MALTTIQVDTHSTTQEELHIEEVKEVGEEATEDQTEDTVTVTTDKGTIQETIEVPTDHTVTEDPEAEVGTAKHQDHEVRAEAEATAEDEAQGVVV